MKIGLNGQLLSNPNPAGPEVFASRLYKTMVSTDSQNDYVLYLEDKAKTELIDQVIRSNPKLEVVILRKVLSWTQISLAIELIRNPVDVFFTPIHTIPGLTSIVTLGKFRPVTMIHGLEYKVNKEYENKHIKKLLHPLILFWTTQVSRKIVVPSQATRDALIRDKFLNVKHDKISVIPEGVDKGFFSKDETEVAKITSKYGLVPGKYLFFISTIQPRKNIPNTIKAFSDALKETGLIDHKLVLAGKFGWDYQGILEEPKKQNIEANVKFLGWTPDEDIKALLWGSKGFVNFSLEEGFGLPLLEALASGIPCAVSDIQAYKDLGKNFPIYANPTSINEMKEALSKLLTSTNYIGTEQVKYAGNYNWENTATKLLQVLQNVVKHS